MPYFPIVYSPLLPIIDHISLRMDLRTALRKEHSKQQNAKIADYVGINKARFKQLVDVYLAGPYRITQRAAWALSLCVERVPGLLGPHLGPILDHLATPGVHDAAKRNTVRLLQFIDIPKRYRGSVVDICFGYLSSKKEPVAVKAFSMSVLKNLVQNEPDLRRELRLVIEDQLPYGSPAFRSRASKVLKEIG
jgi:hypothetical protein